MKKKIKLNLEKEIISELSDSSMGRIKGGTAQHQKTTVETVDVCLGTYYNTCAFDCAQSGGARACSNAKDECTVSKTYPPETQENSALSEDTDCWISIGGDPI